MMAFIRSKLPHVARIFLATVFTVFGLNGFLNFLPAPPMEGPAGAFAGALAATGYMFPLIKATEVVAGLLLLSNRFVPLALTLLAPVTVNILLFHTVLTSGAGLPILIIAAQLGLAYAHRDAFRGMLQAKNPVAEIASPEKVTLGQPARAH
jgi:uncharacterized membrane protein YphA (DoxX/SURF4 family)